MSSTTTAAPTASFFSESIRGWVRLAYLAQMGAVAWLLALMGYKCKLGFALPTDTPAQRQRQMWTILYCFGFLLGGLHLSRSFLTIESGIVSPKLGTFLIWSTGHILLFVLLVVSWSNYLMWINGNGYCSEDGLVTLPLPDGAQAAANSSYYGSNAYSALGAQPEPWQVDAAKASMQDQQSGWVVRNVPSGDTADSASSTGGDTITVPALVSHVKCSTGFLPLNGRVKASGNLSLAGAFFICMCILSAGWGFSSLALLYSCFECKGGNRAVSSGAAAAKSATAATTTTAATTSASAVTKAT